MYVYIYIYIYKTLLLITMVTLIIIRRAPAKSASGRHLSPSEINNKYYTIINVCKELNMHQEIRK